MSISGMGSTHLEDGPLLTACRERIEELSRSLRASLNVRDRDLSIPRIKVYVSPFTRDARKR